MPDDRQELIDSLAADGVPSAITTMALAHDSHLGRVEHVLRALLMYFRVKTGHDALELSPAILGQARLSFKHLADDGQTEVMRTSFVGHDPDSDCLHKVQTAFWKVVITDIADNHLPDDMCELEVQMLMYALLSDFHRRSMSGNFPKSIVTEDSEDKFTAEHVDKLLRALLASPWGNFIRGGHIPKLTVLKKMRAATVQFRLVASTDVKLDSCIAYEFSSGLYNDDCLEDHLVLNGDNTISAAANKKVTSAARSGCPHVVRERFLRYWYGIFLSCLTINERNELCHMKTPDRGAYSQPNQIWFDHRKLHALERVAGDLIKHGITAEGSYRLYEAVLSEARSIINSPDHGELRLNVTEALKSMMEGYPFKGHHLTLLTQPSPAPTTGETAGPRERGAPRRRRRGGGGGGTKRVAGDVAPGPATSGSRAQTEPPAASPTQNKRARSTDAGDNSRSAVRQEGGIADAPLCKNPDRCKADNKACKFRCWKFVESGSGVP